MSKDNKEKTENVYGMTPEDQKELEARATELVELLQRDPKMRLQPYLRVTEFGIVPEVRLVPVENQEKDEERNTGDGPTEGSEKDDGEGGEKSTDAESSEAPSSTG